MSNPEYQYFPVNQKKRIICHLHEEKENQAKIHTQEKKSIFSRSLTYISPSEKKQSKKIFCFVLSGNLVLKEADREG